MPQPTLGKLRSEDTNIILDLVKIFKKHNLGVGLHGTSLWNAKYKDVDVLVFSQANDVKHFQKAFKEFNQKYRANILDEKGDNIIGLDYEIQIENLIIHLSFVILQ